MARARAQLNRAKQRLRRGRSAEACVALDRVAAILDGSEIPADRRADYVWAAREAQRILACTHA